MSDALASGTICFLVNMVERPALAGHVVVVDGPAPPTVDDESDVYTIVAPWLDAAFPGRAVIAHRLQLRPINRPAGAPAGGDVRRWKWYDELVASSDPSSAVPSGNADGGIR